MCVCSRHAPPAPIPYSSPSDRVKEAFTQVMRQHPDSEILWKALRISARPLLVPITFLFLGAIFFGNLVYYFEKIAADEGQANFPDVGTAVWFMLVTFSTVGRAMPLQLSTCNTA